MMAQIQKQFEKRMTINLEEKSKTKMEDMRSKIEALKEENTFRRMAWIPRDILATVTDEKDLSIDTTKNLDCFEYAKYFFCSQDPSSSHAAPCQTSRSG